MCIRDRSYRFYLAAKQKGLPVQMYYHQDDHGGDPPVTMMNRWFTHYLFGIENGVENDAKVQIVREHEVTPTAYNEYPDKNAMDVKFFLQNGSNNNGALSLQPLKGTVPDTLKDDYHYSGAELSGEKYNEHRLLFVSPTLKQDIRISGIPQVTIRLSSSKPAANLSVWLVALPWEDEKETKVYDNIISRGWADPQNYNSLTKGVVLQQDAYYQVTFDPVSYTHLTLPTSDLV